MFFGRPGAGHLVAVGHLEADMGGPRGARSRLCVNFRGKVLWQGSPGTLETQLWDNIWDAFGRCVRKVGPTRNIHRRERITCTRSRMEPRTEVCLIYFLHVSAPGVYESYKDLSRDTHEVPQSQQERGRECVYAWEYGCKFEFSSTDVCMCGCMDVWMCGCMDVQMHAYMDVECIDE